MFRQPKPLAADMLRMEKIIPMGSLRQTGKTRMMSEFLNQYFENGSGPLIVKKMLPDTHVTVHNGKMSMFEFRHDTVQDLTPVMRAVDELIPVVMTTGFIPHVDDYSEAAMIFADEAIIKARGLGKSLSTGEIIEHIGLVNARLGGPLQPTDYQRAMIESFFSPQKQLH